MEEERLAAIELERQKEERRLQEEKSLKNILREQMIEFKAREAEVSKIKSLAIKSKCVQSATFAVRLDKVIYFNAL